MLRITGEIRGENAFIKGFSSAGEPMHKPVWLRIGERAYNLRLGGLFRRGTLCVVGLLHRTRTRQKQHNGQYHIHSPPD